MSRGAGPEAGDDELSTPHGAAGSRPLVRSHMTLLRHGLKLVREKSGNTFAEEGLSPANASKRVPMIGDVGRTD